MLDLVMDKAGTSGNANDLVFGNWSAKMEDGGNEAAQIGLSSGTMGTSKLSPTLHEKMFCKHLIGSVNVATLYHDDVDKAMEKRKASILTLDRHLKVGQEELSRSWNIGLQMVKATLDVMTQYSIQMAVHPMSRQLRIDHLYLHRPRLKGTWYLDTLITKVKLLLGNKCANVFSNGKYTKLVPMTS
jgi:hypothetical protein